MKTLCILSEEWKTFFDIFGLVASIFALFFSGFAFFRPRFLICLYLSDHKSANKLVLSPGQAMDPGSVPEGQKNAQGTNKNNSKIDKRLNISVKNGNKINNRILEIKCEVTLFNCNSDKVRTLALRRNETIILKGGQENYTFYTKNDWDKDKKNINGVNYDYVRVRLLASNFIGMKKHSEGFYRISEIIETELRNYTNIKEKSIIPCP